MCNSTVIIPAVLRALGVGDPFMQEDTVDPRFTGTGLEIARTTFTGIELNLPTSGGAGTTDSDKSAGSISTVVSHRQGSVDMYPKSCEKHRLTTQALDSSLGCVKSANPMLPVCESDVADSMTHCRGGSKARHAESGLV